MAESDKQFDQQKQPLVTENPWQKLKQFTSARIALGRAGNSIPSNELLSFQLDHARAIDAVHKALDVQTLLKQLNQSPVIKGAISSQVEVVSSKAVDRMVYLQRPDLGRQLSESSWQQLVEFQQASAKEYDLAIVVADGLSSTAIQKHALPVIEHLIKKLQGDDNHHWSIAPITLVNQGRVASGDDVGECLKAKISLILIGERPGLTSPDSMGIYITWQPKRGAKDSSRNCISNIRPEGLNYPEASDKAFYLLGEALKRQVTGIGLKDRSENSGESDLLQSASTGSFLLLSKE